MASPMANLASGTSGFVEGAARVVAVDGARVWLEPEPGTSCGGCAAAVSCGTKGIGTMASRLEQRRFSLAQNPNGMHLAVGERVIIGVREDALVKGSLIAYATPLLSLLGAGLVAQTLLGRDHLTLAASVAGLLGGLVLARGLARRLSASGAIAPRLLRRADGPASCATGAES